MKNISIFMSFVAIVAAGLVLAVVINNKGHNNSITPVESKTETKAVSHADNTSISESQIFRDFHSAQPEVIKQELPPLPPVPIPAVPPKPTVESPVTQPIDPNAIVGPVQAPIEKLYTPNSSIVFAVGDLLTIPVDEQKYIRYLSLYNIPKARRKDYAAVLSFMVNSLSTRRKIYIPEFVGASDETVIRLDIRHYEWNPEAWEKLGLEGSGPRPFPEPYFHYIFDQPILEKKKVKKKVMKDVPWRAPNGQQYVDEKGQLMFQKKEVEIEVEEVVSNARKFFVEIAPWLDPLGNKTLYDATHSQFPIFRGDWFLANVSIAPAYYDFLKLGKKDKDFEKLVFADDDLAKKARSQDKGIVISSMVARNNRTLTRSPTFTGGYYWVSHDALKSIDDREYVKIILDEKFDATEDIGSLPNGLQAYFLTDGKGNRLDVANPDIAVDNTANDRQVRTGRSCIVCHSDGIRPIADEIRTLTRKLQDPRQVQLLITRKQDAYRIDDLFSSDLDEQIVKDQNFYRAAVARASGLQSEVLSKVFNEVYNYYMERLLTIEDVSREVGIDAKNLDTYVKASKDNVVLGLLKIPNRPVRRDQWEASFSRFMILIQAKQQGLEHADPFPPGPLITTPK